MHRTFGTCRNVLRAFDLEKTRNTIYLRKQWSRHIDGRPPERSLTATPMTVFVLATGGWLLIVSHENPTS